LLALASKGFIIDGVCGGKGRCGKCKVKISPSPELTLKDKVFLSSDEQDNGWRLACQHKSSVDAEIELKEISFVPKKLNFSIIPSNVSDAVIWDIDSFDKVPISVLQDFSWLKGEKVKFITGFDGLPRIIVKTSEPVWGLALDLGTISLGGVLYNLENVKENYKFSVINPQITLGADVLTRLTYVMERGKAGFKLLRKLLHKGVKDLIGKLLGKIKKTSTIARIAIVANPVITYFFLGLNPLGLLDVNPTIFLNSPLITNAAELGLTYLPAYTSCVILPPCASFLGGDVLAGILSTKIYKRKSYSLLVDLGANAEIVLGNEERLLSVSAAAGPAFEGWALEVGTTACEGSIYNVKLTQQGEVICKTLGNIKPRSICGAGVISLVAELLKNKLINKDGRFSIPSSSIWNKCFRENKFFITPEVYLSQKDLRAIQLAKGAIRGGIEILLKERNVTPAEIKRIYLVGNLGASLKLDELICLGMLPESISGEVIYSESSALEGAILCSQSNSSLDEVKKIIKSLDYISLSTRSDFIKTFVQNLNF